MTRQPPDTPFEIDLNEPATCGVSNRLQRRIRLQFAAVLIGAAVVVGVVVKWFRARATK